MSIQSFKIRWKRCHVWRLRELDIHLDTVLLRDAMLARCVLCSLSFCRLSQADNAKGLYSFDAKRIPLGHSYNSEAKYSWSKNKNCDLRQIARYNLENKVNRKSYVLYRTVALWMTLSDPNQSKSESVYTYGCDEGHVTYFSNLKAPVSFFLKLLKPWHFKFGVLLARTQYFNHSLFLFICRRSFVPMIIKY